MTGAAKQSPRAPQTYLERLPKTLQDELGRAGRRKGERVEPPAPEVREAIAREALTCGVRPQGPALAYVIHRLRHAVGVGDFPSPPAMSSAELLYVDNRVEDILDRLGLKRKAAA